MKVEVVLPNILLVHPGMMGAAIARELQATGNCVSWIPKGRSRDTIERARAIGLNEWGGHGRPDIVLSVCPPAFAHSVAADYCSMGEIYIDANAVSPDRATAIAAEVRSHGGIYVDGSIIGAPPREGNARTRLYLSGPDAADVAGRLGSSECLELIVLQPPFAASALKMTYAAWTKVSAALLLCTRAAAEVLGVEEALVSEWRHSQPELPAQSEAAAADAKQKGWRWTDEMRQVAATFDDCGLPSEFGTGAARVFQRFPGPSHADVETTSRVQAGSSVAPKKLSGDSH
ncbi:DUF1932 domain-containing protein [Mycolicibacterium sp.]|uniref:NAD(P)-dependent oxidoreductase n=1 Tax=Mycolicibacterium sp. TaxID=2320850 RepID=UPI0037C7B67E